MWTASPPLILFLTSFTGVLMTDRQKQIPRNLFRPDREVCLNAISRALLKIRADYGLSAKELGKIADCSPDAIYAGTNGENLLSLDSVALLCEAFPDECAQIVVLFCGGNAPAPTVSDRLERIERELDAIRREAA